MEYSGITVDVDRLAVGMLDLIEEHPHGSCMSLGMFPADLMESLERNLKRKIPDEFYSKKYQQVFDNGKEIRRQIIHDATVKVLELATEKGLCVS